MKHPDYLENSDTRKLRLFLYLVPVLGFFPALWTLYRSQRDEAEEGVSRVAVVLAFSWLFGSTLLSGTAPESDFWALRLLIANSFLTSGYFLFSIWMMVRIWQGQTVELPSFRRLSKRVLK
jgi:uncharacterized membrane protein HdeD (DUF308 family)